MAETKNSFSSILAQFTRLQTQVLEILQGMTEAVGTSAETVTLEFKTASGEEVKYTIPSFGYLEAQIQRLDATVIKLMGLDSSDANIRMPDGSFKKIYQSRLVAAPDRIENLTVPGEFAYRNNWFFESFLSPALYIPVDVSAYVYPDADKILVKRIILNIATEDEKEFFTQNYEGKNNISYEDLIVSLQNNSITFFQDEEVKDLPLSILRYDGSFDVYKYEDITQENPDGTTSKRRKYFLDKLTYSDGLSNTLDTVDLKVDDQIIVQESIYKIDVIDTVNNAITVKNVSGYDSITIGTSVFRIYSEKFSAKEAQVGLGFDERQVVFFKSVDPNFNIVSTDWSDGIGFYSNTLELETTNGIKTLEQFYRSEVTDFGMQFIMAAKEKTIPAVYGEVPNAPELDDTAFQVVRVNGHKLDSNEVKNVNKKAADKVRLNSEIKELDSAIDKKKAQLSNTKFNSDAERRGVKNELDSLIREKTSKSSLYASIVQELAVLGQDKPASLDKPKFRARGFFEVPEPKQSEKTGPQYPVQFIQEFRYVRIDGSASEAKQFEFTDAQGQILRGTYSNWQVVKSELRKKVYNDETGLYEWATEDIENPDVENINQVDIPISKGEKVELRVRAISEAGWPVNPLISDYSATVTIDFPDELLTEDEATIAIQQATEEANRVAFQQELDARGLDLHLSRSFTTGDKYYAHETERISSGFFTNEGVVINLLEKLKSMGSEIAELKAKVDLIKGVLAITILDSDGNRTPVQNGDKVDLFAGYYKDFTDALPAGERKGAIINATYKILLENEESTPLEMISRLPGGIGERLPNTIDPAGQLPNAFGTAYGWVNEAIQPADKDYNSSRRYDLVPIVNNSIDPTETNTASKISSSFHQSQQLPSQFIFARYTDIGLKPNTGDIHFDAAGRPATFRMDAAYDATERSMTPVNTPPVTLPTSPFVWNYSGGSGYSGGDPITSGYLNDFCIHVDHPYLTDGTSTEFSALQNPEITLNGFEEDEIFGDIPITDSDEATSAFRHSFGFNIQNLPIGNPLFPNLTTRFFNKVDSRKVQQLNFRNNWKEMGEAAWLQFINNEGMVATLSVADATYPITLAAGAYDTEDIIGYSRYILPDKYGFIDYDRYLIGKDTCGSYLFMAPSTVDQLLVDGTDMRGIKTVLSGDGNGIEMPVTFQFRMTDYFGKGNTGTGIIGGYDSASTSQITAKNKKVNLTYTRAIGFDVYTRDETIFQFDIQLTAKYRRESLAQKTDVVGKKVSKNRQQLTVKKSQLKNLR
jgi:hypothetical protein